MISSDEIIGVEVSGAVRTVVLNRPEKRNALNSEMLELLYAAFSGEPGDRGAGGGDSGGGSGVLRGS